MVIRVFYIFFLGMRLGLGSSFSQTVDIPDSICWDENMKLKWTDFAGKPNYERAASAICVASVYVIGSWRDGLPYFEVTNYFKTRKAWTKDTISKVGLEHEQLHFDIAELHARLIRKTVDSLRKKQEASFDPYSVNIQYLLDKRVDMDDLYDYETIHSIDTIKQLEWKGKIWIGLDSLKKYRYTN